MKLFIIIAALFTLLSCGTQKTETLELENALTNCEFSTWRVCEDKNEIGKPCFSCYHSVLFLCPKTGGLCEQQVEFICDEPLDGEICSNCVEHYEETCEVE